MTPGMAWLNHAILSDPHRRQSDDSAPLRPAPMW
jgi:hypothetical protein